MNILRIRNNIFISIIFLYIIVFTACSKRSIVNESNNIHSNYVEIQKIKAWPIILEYMKKHQTKSRVFRIQISNDSNAVRIQINYLLKQNDVINRPPLFFVHIDSYLILIYDGMEEYFDKKVLTDKLIKDPLFKQLRFEGKNNFLIYHPDIWEFTLKDKTIVTDTLAKPFNSKHLKRIKAPSIE